MNELEIRLTGGRMTEGVVRIGETVRRPMGAHSQFVHQLLKHLEVGNFEAAPKFLGVDEQEREILSFIAGDVPSDLAHFSDDVLFEAGTLLRRFHDATAHSSLRGDAEVVVHEDFTPCNTVFVNGKPKAIIDFDSAKPGSRRWDLAYSIWFWLDLGSEEIGAAKQAERIRVFCSGYGYEPDAELIADVISWQKRETKVHTEEAIKNGLDPEQHPPVIWTRDRLRWTEENRDALLIPTGEQ